MSATFFGKDCQSLICYVFSNTDKRESSKIIRQLMLCPNKRYGNQHLTARSQYTNKICKTSVYIRHMLQDLTCQYRVKRIIVEWKAYPIIVDIYLFRFMIMTFVLYIYSKIGP